MGGRAAAGARSKREACPGSVTLFKGIRLIMPLTSAAQEMSNRPDQPRSTTDYARCSLRAPSWFRRAPPNTGGGGSAPAYSVSGLGSAAAAASPLARLNNTAGNDGGNVLQQPSEWVLLLCLSFSDGDNGACVETAELSQYQAVNKIPGLKNVLLKKDAFCNTMNDARKIPGVMKASLVPLCFVLPTQYQQFVNVADALGYSAHWMLTPLAPGAKESAPEALDIFTPLGRARIQQASTRRAVVHQALSAPLLVHGQPVSLRVFVLITSLSPLRAYVHTEGMVRLRSYRTGPASATVSDNQQGWKG
ncbi:hypothetical protein HPB51_000274 [Rhipicephalus microplus]|uniref:Uncharacterized protein n=1 Tax=Rhipicephalus microplus TaxID=6941 RepID=A0A9J6DDZ4_RHIMP|nr:hypothetical protein HPB51_000274 [Rhipicephalus microplus]